MIGGIGNDTYVVDNAGDVANETGGSGTDTVHSSVTFSLASTTTTKGSVENLVLTGTAAINATGNSLANTIVGNSGNNVMSGGTGVDTVSYETATAGVSVSLATTYTQSTGGAGNDRLSSFENLTGSAHSDTLTGSSGNNVIRGLGGNDTISGGWGSDVLIGGAGNDLLTGGSSSDRFVFTSLTDGSDVITDFFSSSDKLDLTELTASVGLGDASYATLVANGNIVVTTGNFFTGNSTNGSSTDTRVYFDADGAGGAEAVLVATLEDVKIVSTDFLV
jgi:Ca2+-binding RTX toxin-like protein